MVIFLLLAAAILESSAQPGYIVSLSQNPDGAVASDTRVTFSCLALTTNISWVVGEIRLDNSTSMSGFTVSTHLINESFAISTLSMRAKSNENNTQVTCIAEEQSSNNQTLYIVLAAPPLPPFLLQLALFPDGNTLQARWNRPFTVAGFPITSYTLMVVNKTDGESTRVTIDQDLAQTMTYNLTRSGLHLSCHSLEFSAMASNSVGDSSISNIRISVPRTENVSLHVVLNMISGFLLLTFQAPEVCTYQVPATYTIGVFDEEGNNIVLTKPQSVNMSLVTKNIEIHLDREHSYSVELTVQHPHVIGEAFVTFIGLDFIDTTAMMITTTSGSNSNMTTGTPKGNKGIKEKSSLITVLAVTLLTNLIIILD